METIPKNKINQEKFSYKFNVNGEVDSINFNSFKFIVKKHYEACGFNNVVIDKEDSWMLQKAEKSYAYISAKLKDNII